jgi:hypothetical protein
VIQGADQWIVLAGAVLTFGTALAGFIQSRRNTAKISEVHVLVNSQLQSVMDRVAQLTSVLEHAGVDVPPEPGMP